MRGFKTLGSCLAFAILVMAVFPGPGFSQGASEAQYIAAGTKMYQARNYNQALQYYNAAMKLNPNDPAAYQGIGYCYYAMGNKQYALAYLQKAYQLNPNNAQLAQAIQSLRAQTGGGAVAPGASVAGGSSYLNGGMTLFQRKQYAQAIQYFNAAIQQNPSDYRGYYYAGYSYYMMGNAKSAALYFAIANAKQPNASIKAYGDRVKAGLSPDDQQWVDNQLSRYTGGAAYAGGGSPSKPAKISFGFHLLGGMEYVFADPSQIKQYVTAAGSVSLNGVTPNMVALPEFVPFVQLGDSFEINLAIGYFPVGNLSYTTYDYATSGPTGTPDVWKYTFNTTIITTDLGIKLLFGDQDVKGYLGLGAGISPVSVSFTKVQYDSTATTVQSTDTAASGDYSTVAFNGQMVLGIDFILDKGLSLGPYIGYRYLSANNFQRSGNSLVVDTSKGSVGLAGTNNVSPTSTTPLQLDFSGLEAGLDLSFSF
ncbi:MAG TPA: tetratricopeptide repeat protein [bacterium]|nr:tetratricopeptide repeat protein [bacterium]